MKTLLIAISSLLILAACERTVEGPDWPEYQEKLVVTAFIRLERDSVFAHARVNRTLPLGEPFDFARAMVNDADLSVANDGASYIVPRDESSSRFDFNYGAVTARSADERYALTVRHGGKTARASLRTKDSATRFTTIDVEQSPTGSEEYTLTYTIPAAGSDIFTECLVEKYDSRMGYWGEWSRYTLPNLANRPNGMIEERFLIWLFDGSGSKLRIRYTLTVRNKAYEDYINSRWSWTSGDSPFDPPQKNPPFNVTGDGIGFFWYEIVGEPVEIEY